jgi:hypothetical protein
MRDKNRGIQQALEEIERRRDLMRTSLATECGISVDDHDEWSAY